MTPLTSVSASVSIDCPEQLAAFHFGLAWTPLIGSHPARMARRRAAAARASHYVYCGERGVALALAHLPGTARRWRQFSAASLFAACHPVGAVVWAAALPDGRYWLVGAREGAVLTRTDRIYDAWSDVQTIVDQMVDDYPGLRVLPTQDGLPRDPAFPVPSGHSDDEGIGPDLVARLECLAKSGAPMQCLTWPQRMRWRGWLGLLLMGVAGALAMRESLHAPAIPVPSAPDVPTVSEAQRQTQLTLAVQAQWGGAQSYVNVVSSFRALPVVIAGWRIAGAQCVWSKSVWSCEADYRRDSIASTNLGLLEQVPQGWHVRFTPLSTAHIAWTVADVPTSLSIDSFPEPAWVDTTLVSVLQARAPAFAHIKLGTRSDLLDDTPRPATAVIDPPDVLALPGRRSLTLQGPLRSFGVLDDLAGHVAWVQVVMGFRQGITPGLSRSALQLELKGWVHEK